MLLHGVDLCFHISAGEETPVTLTPVPVSKPKQEVKLEFTSPLSLSELGTYTISFCQRIMNSEEDNNDFSRTGKLAQENMCLGVFGSVCRSGMSKTGVGRGTTSATECCEEEKISGQETQEEERGNGGPGPRRRWRRNWCVVFLVFRVTFHVNCDLRTDHMCSKIVYLQKKPFGMWEINQQLWSLKFSRVCGRTCCWVVCMAS